MSSPTRRTIILFYKKYHSHSFTTQEDAATRDSCIFVPRGCHSWNQFQLEVTGILFRLLLQTEVYIQGSSLLSVQNGTLLSTFGALFHTLRTSHTIPHNLLRVVQSFPIQPINVSNLYVQLHSSYNTTFIKSSYILIGSVSHMLLFVHMTQAPNIHNMWWTHMAWNVPLLFC